jgi:aspartyl-tRNA(Asn)/glutamyl-tRNA(Gln) amidotransferase subunit A
MPLAPAATLADFRSRLARGEATHEALVRSALERAAQPAAAQAFTRLYADAALAAARHADAAQAAGLRLGPLAGLPVTIKDLYDVAGETTLAGSVVRRGAAPAAADAPAVQRLRAAGAAIIGRTNMTEFAFSGVGINPHFGTPANPAWPGVGAHIPGGSSSGAAVSVALGIAVAALGSDTGGSIRIPAALCGLVGFKSTQARTPRAGAFELSRTLDTVCAMAQRVADCITVDAAIADAPLAVEPRPLEGLRLALPGTLMLDALEPAVATAFERALTALSAAGARIVEQALPELAEIAVLNAPGGFSAVEAFAVHSACFALERHRFDPRVAQRIALGEPVAAAQYIALQDRRRDWIVRTGRALAGFDAIVSPTVPILAPEIAALQASDEAFFRANGLLLRNTFVANYLDGCSFSLPCQAPGEAPVGLMLTAVGGRDARLAGVALAVEAALDAALQRAG